MAPFDTPYATRRNFVKMFDACITRMIGLYRMVKKLWRYVKPFSFDTGTLRTDRRTDRQTDGRTYLLYQYRASVCWRAIKIVIFDQYLAIAVLSTLRPLGGINTVPPDRGKLVTLIASSKLWSLLISVDGWLSVYDKKFQRYAEDNNTQ